MNFVKNSNFLHGLFLLKTGLAMTFGDVLDRKEALLDCKKCISYSRKTGYFAKGLTHDFSQKSFFSDCVFLLKIGQEMMFGNVLKRKEGLLHHKKICFISKKNGILSKGVNP